MPSRTLETIPREGAKPLPRLYPNYKKILESVLFLINEADRRGLYLTEYDIYKNIFIADIKHLNEYGRPVTFDNYVAMEHGPVPSATRDILQPKFKGKLHFDESWPLWNRVPSPSDGPKSFKLIRPKRKENLRILSKSDLSALTDALLVVKSLRFGGVKDYTHKHPAYVDAWVEGGARDAYDIDYAKLLDSPDEELIEDLVYSSKHM
jgi:Antitoxin SocA-like, Panacea domain